MNTRYPETPEIISSVTYLENDEEGLIGDVVTGIHVNSEDGKAVVKIDLRQIDLREAKNSDHLMVEIELHELIAALSLATLNADRD